MFNLFSLIVFYFFLLYCDIFFNILYVLFLFKVYDVWLITRNGGQPTSQVVLGA